MFKDPAKEAIRKHYADRQVTRDEARLARRAAETEEAIAGTEIETRMTVDDGLAFLRASGEREDAA
ncbi:hypothetical protein GOB57_22020 [Sinorhizobium meliloti]|nr:hypothetical protein [Sinorhizobium meliloti]